MKRIYDKLSVQEKAEMKAEAINMVKDAIKTNSLPTKPRMLRCSFSCSFSYLESAIEYVHVRNGKRYFQVYVHQKNNIVDEDFNLLSDIWFDMILCYSNSYIEVGIYDSKDIFAGMRHNLLGYDGKLLFDAPLNKWFRVIEDFHEGLCLVYRSFKANFINNKGKLISDTWFNNATSFQDGFSVVTLHAANGSKNVLKKNGKLLLPDNYPKLDQIWVVEDNKKIKPYFLAVIHGNRLFFDRKGNTARVKDFYWSKPTLKKNRKITK